MKKSVRANVVLAAVLLFITSASSELAQPSTKLPAPQLAETVSLDLPLPQLSGLIFEESKIEMEDYGYTLGAESALEPIHLAPSGYITAQYDTRFAIQPVPEPETYAMLLAGAGILGIGLRRRFQKVTTSPN